MDCERCKFSEEPRKMFEFTWIFWMLVVVLFAESWGRVWAGSRQSESGAGREPRGGGNVTA
jgi:hypothetical protein